MFFIKMRILRLVLKIFDVSKYSIQSIPTKKLPAPLLADHYHNLNAYYDISLKKDRLSQLLEYTNFKFHKINLSNQLATTESFTLFLPDIVIHLAAQAGVCYSLENPHAYIESNIVGFVNILEACRQHEVKHLIYASSSSVYGANTKVPFAIGDPVESPMNLYACTKRSGELMAYTYSHLYKIPTTGLRFFTVYGPWGRPDMAYFLFTRNILEGKPINIFNYGNMKRDFTYIDDIVESILKIMPNNPKSHLLVPYNLYNIGNSKPVDLQYFISVLEKCLGIKAQKEFLPIQAGELTETYADINELIKDTGFKPKTSIEVGLSHFVDWYLKYYGFKS